ncbi:MAG: hypothetical protein OES23_07310, partial [Nitrosopumilus sp.]|nr:hypothetical protein [Nitrosopumilus sp.]
FSDSFGVSEASFSDSFGVSEASFSDSFGVSEASDRQIEHLDTIEKNCNLYQIIKVLRVNQLRTAILSDSIRHCKIQDG